MYTTQLIEHVNLRKHVERDVLSIGTISLIRGSYNKASSQPTTQRTTKKTGSAFSAVVTGFCVTTQPVSLFFLVHRRVDTSIFGGYPGLQTPLTSLQVHG